MLSARKMAGRLCQAVGYVVSAAQASSAVVTIAVCQETTAEMGSPVVPTKGSQNAPAVPFTSEARPTGYGPYAQGGLILKA